MGLLSSTKLLKKHQVTISALPLLIPAMQLHTAQSPIALPAPRYDPDHLLATLIERLNLKNDAALSRALEVSPPVISKIRHRRLPVTASLLIRMHEVSALSIKELRLLMGDRRQKFRISDKHFKPK
jgi:hypothetical protein